MAVSFREFLCLILVLISSFLKYRWKRAPEAILSWIGVMILANAFHSSGGGWSAQIEQCDSGVGYMLACAFAVAGAIMKTWLLIFGRKLNT